MTNAADRGWGPGYPTPRSSDMVKVTNGRDVAVWVHREISPIVAYLFGETERRGYRLRPGQCWGYASRPIRGGKAPSNHSWGLAVDINAPANPMVRGRLITDMPAWMPALWKDHGFGWGGDYRSRKDAMHYEFLGNTTEAAIQRGRLVADAPAPPPKQPPGGGGEPVLRLGAKGAWVVKLQTLLRGACQQPVASDGDFGPRTKAAVLVVQRSAGLVVDGVVGEATWAVLYLAARTPLPANR